MYILTKRCEKYIHTHTVTLTLNAPFPPGRLPGCSDASGVFFEIFTMPLLWKLVGYGFACIYFTRSFRIDRNSLRRALSAFG
jgi:hypothetical protein